MRSEASSSLKGKEGYGSRLPMMMMMGESLTHTLRRSSGQRFDWDTALKLSTLGIGAMGIFMAYTWGLDYLKRRFR